MRQIQLLAMVAIATVAAWAPIAAAQPVGYMPQAKVGGQLAPDGRTEIQVDLPGDQQQRNIASKGLGCCVFRSIDHASRWQNIPALQHMPEWMVQKGIEGGGYPAKVDQLIPAIAKDRGLPTPRYVQVEGAGAMEVIRLACKTGRMPCVTYSRSPTGRYNGQQIAHMVNCAHCDGQYLAILDNNYVDLGDKTYEWMTPEEYERVCNGGKGNVWVIVFLDNPPPPVPHN